MHNALKSKNHKMSLTLHGCWQLTYVGDVTLLTHVYRVRTRIATLGCQRFLKGECQLT